MTEYRVVEYSQSIIGEILSRVLPNGLRPSMRKGNPVYLSGRLKDKKEAREILFNRYRQLERLNRLHKVTADIEELD